VSAAAKRDRKTPTPPGVLKHGIGYDLVVVEERGRLVLGIRCHVCSCVSYHPKDVSERYCGVCDAFYEDGNAQQA
jgi:hypothetical protein